MLEHHKLCAGADSCLPANVKVCTTCDRIKRLCWFAAYRSICKPCRIEISNQARRDKLKDPEQREKYNEYMRSRTASMTDEQLLARQLKVYKLTIEDWERMLKEQDGKCPCCLQVLDTDYGNGKRKLHVDHCHTTGRVRGLLCNNCNLMLGHAKDNPATLTRAATYILGAGE